MKRTAPHHNSVLAVVGVVAAATRNGHQSEPFIQPYCMIIARAHLERDPTRANGVRALDERRKHRGSVAAPLMRPPDANCRDMGFPANFPQTAVRNNGVTVAQHEVLRLRIASEFRLI